MLTGALAAAGGTGDEALPVLVVDIGWALVASGLLAVVFLKLRIPTVAAFLAAGVLIGPIGLGLVTDPASIETIAQLGLVLLLFVIGLELDVRELIANGKTLLTSGFLQYPLTVVFGFLVAQGLLLVGVASGFLSTGFEPLYLGLAIAASSTLLVVQLFQQSLTLDTKAGRVALALLVFQDIWAIVVLAVQPNLDNPSAGPILASFAGIAILALLAFLLARSLLPWGFGAIAKKPEIVLVASLAWCFAVVLAGLNFDKVLDALFGIDPGLDVSPGIGALIAGATIAALPYRADITPKVSLLRDFFITLFFVGVGMGIQAPDGPGVLVFAVSLAAIALAARALVMLPLLSLSGLDGRTSVSVSAKLSQISEFSLVIAFLGAQLGHIGDAFYSAVVFAFVIAALPTPWLFAHADRLAARSLPLLQRLHLAKTEATPEVSDDQHELALLGMHRTGSALLAELQASEPDLLGNTVVLDFNMENRSVVSASGAKFHYCDLANPEALQHAHVDTARVVLCTIPDDVLVGTTNAELLHHVQSMNPTAVIIMTAVSQQQAAELRSLGADAVLMPPKDAAHSAAVALIAGLNGDREALAEINGVVGTEPK